MNEEVQPNGTEAVEDTEQHDPVGTVASGTPVAAPADTITIPIKEAKQLYELYKNIEAADGIYHACQSRSFRDHMSKVYRATNVAKAYDKLKSLLEAVGGV